MMRGITLAALVATWRRARRARMTRDTSLRALARMELEHAARELLRFARSLETTDTIGHRFASKKRATCATCGGAIVPGDEIAWLPRTPICSSCVGDEIAEDAA